jgi:IS5 family transposase
MSKKDRMTYNWLDEENRLIRLSKLGDPLEKIEGNINWEEFRPTIVKALKETTEARSKAEKNGKDDGCRADEAKEALFLYQEGAKPKAAKGGRPAYDCILMLKIVILQQLYNIANDAMEYQINDRLSFQRFLGLSLGDRVPDGSTIWLFKESLKNTNAERKLFKQFTDKMEDQGVITRKGSIIDATFVDVPKQRNMRDENKIVKEGGIPEAWEAPDQANMLRQKDLDASWAKKNDEVHFGYKDHTKVDAQSKLIVEYRVSDAAMHDSQVMEELIDEKDNAVNADSAYASEEMNERILEQYPHITLRIHEKGARNRPLTEEQKESNREKSKVRCRVEHVYGHMTVSMGGIIVRTIGFFRAKFHIGMKNFAYNLYRYAFLKSREKVPSVI